MHLHYQETCQARRFMASCGTPHVSFTPPGEHIGLDSLADSSPPGQAKGFGQCKERVMSGASTIKPRRSSKNLVKVDLVSQDVTSKRPSKFIQNEGLRIPITGE